MSEFALARLHKGRRAAVAILIGIMYLRASQDATGRSISVASQEDEGGEFFEENGIQHYATYSDNNQSGSLFAKEARGDYEQALEDLRAGRANLLWTFDHSRAQRDLEVYTRLRRICIETGAFWAYGGRIYDMTDPTDRKITARDAAEAEGASDNISIHTRRGKRQRAKRGEHAGKTAYGYEPRYCDKTGVSLGWVIVEEEAKVIRRIVKACLDRKSLTSIADALNADGVPCPHDRRWDSRKVRKLAEEHQHASEWNRFLGSLTEDQRQLACSIVARLNAGENPKEIGRELNREAIPYFFASQWSTTKVRNIALSKPAAGLRVHQGEIVTRKAADPEAPGGFRMVPIEVVWKRIKTPAQHAQLVALLTAPERRTRRDGVRVKHWWSGIALCGVCGSVVSRRKRGTVPRYSCLKNSCVARDQVLVDAWLTEQALLLLEREDAAQLFRLDQDVNVASGAQIEAERLRAQLDGFRDDAIAERITRESFAAFEAALLPKIKRADELAKRASLPPTLVDVIGPNARKVFLNLTIAEQREILRAIMRPRIYHTTYKRNDRLETDAIDPGFLYGGDLEPLADVVEPVTIDAAA